MKPVNRSIAILLGLIVAMAGAQNHCDWMLRQSIYRLKIIVRSGKR